MKFRLFLLLLLIAGAFSCAEDRPAPQVLKTSEQSISFSGKPGAWMLTVNSNTSWTVENETDWCKVDKTAGVNTENLVVSVDSNNTGAARSNPGEILVITFTKAAAREMRGRYLHMTGEENTKVSFGTFHAVFFQILKLAYGYRAEHQGRDYRRLG